MQNYELMVIFTPILSEEGFKSAQKKYKNFILKNKGEILHSNPWGLKTLAYPIKKKTTAIYWVLEFKAETNFNTALNIQLSRDENIFRYMITKLDKHAVAYNASRPNRQELNG
ncbi:MAG: 30S ribosomal protein S6 [Chitinophagaceae bacterium]